MISIVYRFILFVRGVSMKGLIKYLGLESWFTSLSKDEQRLLIDKYGPDLTENQVGFNSSPSQFLSELSSFVNTKDNAVLCEKIVNKALELQTPINTEDYHFFLMHIMEFYYKNKDKPEYLELAKKYLQIGIDNSKESIKSITKNPLYNVSGAPENPFYTNLAILYKKEKKWTDIITLCEQGKKEGWPNDFDKRIDEAKKHL